MLLPAPSAVCRHSDSVSCTDEPDEEEVSCSDESDDEEVSLEPDEEEPVSFELIAESSFVMLL